MKQRHLFKIINNYLEGFPVVVLLGVRQSGKSTLCKMIAKEDWKFFDLENRADFELVSADPDLFLKANPGRLVLDEAQQLPSLFPALRVAVDRQRKKNGRFLITGSSSPELSKQISESLAGRVAIIQLPTFSMAEAYDLPVADLFTEVVDGTNLSRLSRLTTRLTHNQVMQCFLKGGFPEPCFGKSFPDGWRTWMNSFEQTYILRDIRRLFPRLALERYRSFFGMSARMSGETINKAKLAEALAIDQSTVADYFQILEGTFLWKVLPPYTRNAAKRFLKSPKGYLRDSGLVNFLNLNHSLERLERDPSIGSQWEGFIVEEIVKGFAALGRDPKLYFYRAGSYEEVDLIVEADFGTIPIEIKYGTTTDPKRLQSLKNFVRRMKLPFGLVINNSERVQILSENIIQVPATAL